MHYGNADGNIFNFRGTIHVGVDVHRTLLLSSLAETASSVTGGGASRQSPEVSFGGASGSDMGAPGVMSMQSFSVPFDFFSASGQIIHAL